MAGWSRVILHPILFSVYPVLFIFVHNLSEVEPVDRPDAARGGHGDAAGQHGRARDDHSTTHESITSSLNMDYLEGHGYSAASSAAAAFLRSLGYRYVLVPSGVPFTNHSPLANVTVELGIWTESQLSALLLEYSAIWFVANTPQRAIEKGIFAGVGGMGQWHEHITRSIEAIDKVAKTKAPTFTFAHIVSPHPPYVFNSDGSLNRHGNMGEIGNFDHYNWWSASDLFVNQVVHLNRLVDGMVTRILARSATPPIIIIHGDHGTYALSGKRWRTDDPPPELIKERMSILLAWHAPEPLRRKLHDSMTPVNIFRIVFNECFGARFPLLPDRNVWSFDSPMHDVTDVVRETR